MRWSWCAVLSCFLAACGGADVGVDSGGGDGHGAADGGGADAAEMGDGGVPGDGTVGGDAGIRAFDVKIAPVIAVTRGRDTDVTIKIVRSAVYHSAVDVVVSGLPPGVIVAPLTVAADSTAGTLRFTTAAGTPEAPATPVTIAASGGGHAADVAIGLIVTAPHGDLDASFGTGGLVAGPGGSALASTPDGAVVVVRGSGMDLVITRLLDDGAPDPAFGAFGDATLAGEGHALLDVAALGDGSIVVASADVGGASIDVMRLLDDGSLDPTFGGTGLVALASMTAATVRLIAQPDGRVLVAASSGGAGPVEIRRLAIDGALDASFAVSGDLVVSPATAIATGPTGDVALLQWPNATRYDLDGAPAGGYAVVAAGGEIAVLGAGDDLVVASGASIVWCAPDGSQVGYMGPSDLPELPSALVLDQSDRTIMASGDGVVSLRALFGDGSLDVRWGDQGTRTLAIGGLAGPRALAVDGAGRLVVLGHNGIARILP